MAIAAAAGEPLQPPPSHARSLPASGEALRAAEMQAKGHKISHEGVQGVLKGQRRLG
jgi:hypothetical protein